MTFTRPVRVAVLALAAAAAAAAGLAAVASTGTARAGEKCPAKTLCVYENNGFGGQVVKIDKPGLSNKLASKMNNGASSVVNNRNKRAFLYDKKDGKGDKLCISPKATLDALELFNDLASSSKNTDSKNKCVLG